MAENIFALSNEIEKEKLQAVARRIDGLSQEVNQMVDKIVDGVCADLDEYMKGIDDILTNQEYPVTDSQLDDFILNLSSLLYYVSAAQEILGVKEDVSRAVQKDIYNRVREKAQGTVADKDMAAELQSQNEALTTVIYNRAYKKVKLKIESAWEMINSIKKVMSRRIAETEMNQADKGRIGR